jgi:hypothetical protein
MVTLWAWAAPIPTKLKINITVNFLIQKLILFLKFQNMAYHAIIRKWQLWVQAKAAATLELRA